MKVSVKAVVNSYITKHLFGKSVSVDQVREVLETGVEQFPKHPKEGCRYFAKEMAGAGLPGRFVIPSEDTPGIPVANWCARAEHKIRHGHVVTVIDRSQVPEWLARLERTLWVIVEPNTDPDTGRLQVEDGPSEDDPEGDWIVSTAHWGPPSMRHPRLPRKGEATAENLREYLENLRSFQNQEAHAVFVDLEKDGVVGLPSKVEATVEGVQELLKLVAHLQSEVASLRKQVARGR